MGVGGGHGIAAEQEAIRSVKAAETVKEEAMAALGKYDVAQPEFTERAALDLDYVARPKSGQHTLPMNPHTHSEVIVAAQDACHQNVPDCAPTRARRTHCALQRQEVFRED